MNDTRQQTSLVCDHCETSTVHTLLVSEESEVTVCDADGYESGEPATVRLFQCGGCNQVSLYIWSALHSPGAAFGERVFPPLVVEMSDPAIPIIVQDAYREAKKVKRRSHAAYAVMVRRALEVIVREQGIHEQNLFRAISILSQRGSIPPILIEATSILRGLGNIGAHLKGEDLNSIHAELIEWLFGMLINYLYKIPATLNYFKCFVDIGENKGQID